MAQFYADRIALGSQRARTPEGYLLCLGVPFARTGFQNYRASELGLGGEELVKVYREYNEVFDPATLGSFEGKTVTSPHPPLFLTHENDGKYYKGHAQNIRQGARLPDGEYSLIADLLVKDGELIKLVESGKRLELSAGYECLWVPDEHSPGVFRQTKIRGNHIAIVEASRCGAHCKILDCECQSKEEESPVAENTATPVVDDKVSIGAITGLLRLLGIGGVKVNDSESEAVERNEKINKEALLRATRRNEDADEKSEEKMTEEEKAAEAKKTKDAAEEKEERKKLTDSINRLVDAIAEKEEKKEKAEDEDKDDKDKKKVETEDDDLIPVATLGKEDQPKNPIPGADKALDCILGMKQTIADSGDKAAIALFNDAVRTLKKGRTTDNSGYRDLTHPKKGDEVKNAAYRVSDDAENVRAASVDFVETSRQFLGRNPGEAFKELRASEKEKK